MKSTITAGYKENEKKGNSLPKLIRALKSLEISPQSLSIPPKKGAKRPPFDKGMSQRILKGS